MKNKKLLKTIYEIDSADEVIIFQTENSPYVITMCEITGEYFIYGATKTKLTNFLLPGISLKTSLQSGEYFKINHNLKNAFSLYNLDDNKLYYELRLKDNINVPEEKPRELLFIFDNEEDVVNMIVYITKISNKYKLCFNNLEVNKWKN